MNATTQTTSPASRTPAQTDAQCCSYALEAMQYAKSHTFPDMRVVGHDQAECERAILFCADRIIALRTMHAIGDLTIDSADRGAIAGTLRSQQVTP